MLKPSLPAPGAELRALMEKDAVLLPGVFNAISARAAMAAGAKALYISGAGVTNAELGVPDQGLLTLTELARTAANIAQIASLPILCDADTGFGDTMNVARTVLEMERAGVAGIHLEDQSSPKRCGHLDGKELITPEAMAAKVTAAVESKRDPSFLVVARTDAFSVEGLDAAISRAKRYVDAGADAVFPEGLPSEREFEAFRNSLSVPLLANMTEFGKTDIIPFERFKLLGYNLVIFPMTAFRVMLKAISDTYDELLATGTQAGMLKNMRTRAELYELIEYDSYTKRDLRWADAAMKKI